jgi:hypothetical protein
MTDTSQGGTQQKEVLCLSRGRGAKAMHACSSTAPAVEIHEVGPPFADPLPPTHLKTTVKHTVTTINFTVQIFIIVWSFWDPFFCAMIRLILIAIQVSGASTQPLAAVDLPAATAGQCYEDCVPKGVKKRDGVCCVAGGHESLACPGPAHHRCPLPSPSPPPPGTIRWNLTLSGVAVQSTPTLSPDGATVYIGTDTGNVHAIHTASGTRQWTTTTTTPAQITPPTVHSTSVYVGSADSNLYAFSAADGSKRWSYATGGKVEASTPCTVRGARFSPGFCTRGCH